MRLLILEDDPVWFAEMARNLGEAGYDIIGYTSVAKAKTALRQDSFDLMLLDWNLPEESGYDLLIWAMERLKSCPPVIMVTSRSDPRDIVLALDTGADDFIIKPCEPHVLKARVAALLRRAYPHDHAQEDTTEICGVVFDHATSTVAINGEVVSLTGTEYALALLLFQNIGRPMGRAHLLDRVWGTSPNVRTRTLDVHISKIRNRLDLRAEKGFRLLPVYNFGYRLEQMQAETAAEA